MESNSVKVKILDKDCWDMDVVLDETLIHSFKGKTPKSISEMLIGVKKYMDNKTQSNGKQN